MPTPIFILRAKLAISPETTKFLDRFVLSLFFLSHGKHYLPSLNGKQIALPTPWYPSKFHRAAVRPDDYELF
jgi:hypothetical protein